MIKLRKLVLNQVGNFKLPQMGKITLPLTGCIGDREMRKAGETQEGKVEEAKQEFEEIHPEAAAG